MNSSQQSIRASLNLDVLTWSQPQKNARTPQKGVRTSGPSRRAELSRTSQATPRLGSIHFWVVVTASSVPLLRVIFQYC